jgi:hypothetical protein
MRTEDLISALAADTIPQPGVGTYLVRGLPMALVVSGVLLAVFWGPRPDLGATLASLAVLKTLVPLGLVGLGLVCAIALVHPGMTQKWGAMALGAAGAALVALFVFAMVRDGWGGLVAALSTPSLAVCLLSIPVLSGPFMVAAFWGLSSGAPLRPGLTGAAAGLVAGGLAAAVYSMYCDKDMVLFVIPAYATAIGFVVLCGALLGPRYLKW